MKNVNHLIFTGSVAARRFCTSGEGLAQAAKKEIKQKPNPNAFYRVLSPLPKTGESVVQAANKYIRAGNKVAKWEVEHCVKKLRTFKRFEHALELLEWMEKRGINFSFGDHAIRLDLISEAKGIDAAEEYFNKLDEPAKNKQTYGSLLNCYCKKKMTEKALALFDKMNELNYASTPLAYNNLLALYMRSGKPEMIPPLVQEMKDKDIPMQTFTYNVLINSYGSMKDIDAVERVMEEMQIADSDKCKWTTYSNLAVIYIEAGLHAKAELALKQLEEKLKPYSDRMGYHFLISLYASTSNLEEVHRVWCTLKEAYPNTVNLSYLCMLQALDKLNDFEGLKKYFEEWESGCSNYDMKLTNIVIRAYLQRDMFEEAKLLCEDSVKRGFGPNVRTHEMYMDFFLRSRQPALAMKCMENAFTKGEAIDWKPKPDKVGILLKQFEEEKDVACAEKLCEMLKKVNSLDSEAYRLLLSTYIAAGKIESQMRQRMKDDEIEISSEIEELLQRVCP